MRRVRAQVCPSLHSMHICRMDIVPMSFVVISFFFVLSIFVSSRDLKRTGVLKTFVYLWHVHVNVHVRLAFCPHQRNG